MGPREIDPSAASVDLDALTLKHWSYEQGTITLLFVGGLGRVTTADGQAHLLDDIGNVRTQSAMVLQTEQETAELEDLLNRWVSVGTPLRYLEFETSLLIVEDTDNYLSLPAQARPVHKIAS